MKIKNMKIGKIIVSILLVSTLLFSLLNIIRVGAKEPSIILTNAVIESKSDTIEGGINTFDSTKVVSNVTYHKLNDYVTYKLTLKNNENKEIKILDITDDNTFEHIVYEYDKHTDEVIDSKNSFDLVIKASYKNETEYNAESNKEVKIKITYEIEDEKKEEVVPITGDNLYIYIILLILSIIGLVIAFVTNKKIKRTMVLLLLITPFITKALTDSVIVTISGNIKIQDKQTVKFKVGDEETSKIVYWGSKAEKPNNPEKTGYNFLGWYDGDNLYNFDNEVKNDITLTAKFEPKDVTYRVIHKQQNLDNNEYTEYEHEDVPGKYDQQVTPNVKSYTGFTSPSTQTVTLGLDTTVTYEYRRNSYKVTYQYEGTVPSNPPELPEEKTYKYGANVPIENDVTLTGYNFSGWDTASSFTMPDHNVIIKGSFTAKGDTAYTVEHYWQHIGDNDYELHESVPLTGQTDTEATATSNQYTGFTYDENNSNNIKSGNIDRDGSRVLKLYYNRNVRKVIYAFSNEPNGHSAIPAEESYRYGATVTVKGLATAPGYSFVWDRSGTFTMPDENVTITGTFTPGTSDYTVEHWTEKLDGTYELLNDNIETEHGTTDTQATATAKTITGFTQDSTIDGTVSSGNIDGDNSRVLKLYYKRNVHSVTYSYTGTLIPANASAVPTEQQYKYGAQVSIAGPTSATGYIFDGWNVTEAFTMPDNDVSITGTFSYGTSNYKVSYYYQTNGTYGDADSSVTRQGTTDSTAEVTNEDKTPQQTGYVLDSSKEENYSGTINYNGTLELKVYFKQQFSVTYAPGEHGTFSSTTTNNLDYNADTPAIPTITGDQGYHFTGWNPERTDKVTETVTYTAQWAPNTDTNYKVSYYYQTNGTYGTADSTVTRTGTTGATVEVTNEDKTPTQNGYILDDNATNKLYSGTITADGSLELKVFFKKQYSVTYAPGEHGTFSSTTTNNLDYNADTPDIPTITGDQGYHFTGWDPERADKVTETVTYTAQWAPDTDTPYKVKYYYQLNGSYEVTPAEVIRYGTTDTTAEVTNEDKTPEQTGYVLDSSMTSNYSGTITGNGNLELKVYFKQQFSVTYAPGNHGTFSSTTTNNLDYNADTPNAPETTGDQGYHFTGWDPERADKVTETVTYTAQWAPNTDTNYKVSYFYQTNGTYGTADSTVTRQGTTDTTAEVTDGDKTPQQTGYVLDSSMNTDYSGTITGDGNLELKVYFKQQFSVTYAPGEHGTFSSTTTNNLDYNANTPNAPETTGDQGYHFTEWSPEIADKVTATVTYTAQWAPNTDTPYKVKYYYQLNGSYEVTPAEVIRYGTTGQTAEVTNEDKTPDQTGYVLDSSMNSNYSGTIAADGSLELKVYFKQQFSVTYDPGDHGAFEAVTTNNLDYNADTPAAPTPTPATGYEFASWSPQISPKVTQNTTYVAQWTQKTANYYVEHYHEQLDGTYSKYYTETLSGNIGDTANAVAIDYSSLHYHIDSGNENEVTSGTINAEGTLTLKLYYNLDTYTITFNSTSGNTYNGDDIVNDITITKKHGATLALSELPTKPTYNMATLKQDSGIFVNKQHNALDGWYTTASDGTKITTPVVITEDKEYFAYWEEVPITCKKATTLHTATCTGTDSGCVKNHRYTAEGLMQSTTIVYGETSASTTPVISDAYDCDINNDQIYDSTYERFYYLGDDGDNAIMIYYSNWDGEKRDTTLNYAYNDALTRLPNSNHTEWYNVENPTRFLTLNEALTLCDTRQSGNKYTYTGCEYLLEQSGFEQDVPPNNVRSGIWLQKTNQEWRIHTRTLEIDHESQKNVVKPVVLIPKSEIENRVLDTYTITYNSMGGNIDNEGNTKTVTIPAGSAIRIPPTPTKNGNTFAGWYTTETYDINTKISLPVIVYENKTYYAKWTSASGNAARIGDVEYFTLQDAIDAVEENGTSATTIQLIKDTTEDIVIDNNKNILLNMLGHTITNNSNNGHVITVNSGSSLSMFNGTVTTNSSKEMINNAGTLDIAGGTYNATGTGGGISNTGSLTMRNEYTMTTTSSTNPSILNNGTLQISNGTIKSTGTYAIYNESGTFQVGEKGNSTLDYPVIQGDTYGIVSKVDYKLYDGVIKGKTYPIGKAVGDTPTITSDPDKTMIIEQDDQVIYIHGSETQGEQLYQTMYMRYWDVVFAVTFDNGVDAIPNIQTLTVPRGSALNALPQEPTRYGYIFKGWYKTTDYNESDKITTATIPEAPAGLEPTDHNTAYVTYYAKWEENTDDIHMVTLNAGSGYFASNNNSTLTFQAHEESPLSAFPEEPLHTNSYMNLVGWYSDPNFENAVTFPLQVNDDITYYAKWENTSIAKVNGEYCNCSTLIEAFNMAPQNATTQTTIELLRNTETNIKIQNNKKILLDLGGYRIVNAAGSGTDSRVIQVLSGELEVINGTLRSDTSENVIYVATGSKLTVGTDAILFQNKDKQAINNDGGNVIIKDNAVIRALSNNTSKPRGAIQNANGGTLTILGGEIINEKAYGIYNQNGTVIIGTEDGTIDATSPVIQAKTYGIISKNSSMVEFYDGIIKAGPGAYPLGHATTDDNYNPTDTTADTTHATISNKQEPSIYEIGNETISSTVYTTLYLNGNAYTLSFNPGVAGNNATITPNSMTIRSGDAIGTLPAASWDATYILEGWYTESTGGTKITTETIPTGDTTYYAHWEEVGETYSVTYMANGGGSSMAATTGLTGTFTLPTASEVTFTAPTTNKRFKGWSLTTDGEIITTLEMTEDKTVYAIWEDIPMICHVVTDANDLSTETCNSASNKGCKKAGITGNITYGHIYNGTSLDAGTALDCKLTKEGSNYYRFYYLTTENGNAVLLSHSILSLASPGTLMDNNEEIIYTGALDSLPTANQWDNLPVTFDIDNDHPNRAARLATVEEIRTACGLGSGTTSTEGSLDSCSYVLTSTGFGGNTGKSCYWIDKHNTTYLRVRGDTRLIGGTDSSGANANGNSKNSVKAVIEVPTNLIEVPTVTKATITYNAGSGTVTPTSEEYDAGSTVSSFPTPVYTGHIFDGWYDSNDTLVTSLVLTTDTTIFAHYADIDTTNISITEGGTHNVFNTQPNNISNYSIESTDTSIATVSNGVITGVSAGNTTVTVTNTTNSQSITLNVEVTGIARAYTTSQAVKEYFENVSSYETQFASDGDQTAYTNQLKSIFTANKCSYCGSSVDDQGANSCSPSSGANANVYCDQPMGYDTGVNGAVNVYTDDTKTTPVTYTTSTDGTIYNMIPGETYYWEDANDSSVNGTVEAVGERRLLKASGVRNLRDLGGMAVSYTDGTGTKTGTLKYEKLYRGAQITSASGVTELEKLGIDREIDLRATSEQNTSNKLNKYDTGTKDSYTDIVVVNYHINPEATAYLPTESAPATSVSVTHQCGKNHLDEYRKMKAVVRQVMKNVIAGESVFFHCTIGTDRTGTLAYFLEGLLGVGEMDRLRDYELTYYFGLTNRSRFHDQLGSTINPRFYSMYRSYPTNDDIYDWYTYENTVTSTNDPLTDDQLLAQFRQAMIDYNN